MIKLQRIILDFNYESQFIETILESIKKAFNDDDGITEEELLKIDECWLPHDYIQENYKNYKGSIHFKYEVASENYIELFLEDDFND